MPNNDRSDIVWKLEERVKELNTLYRTSKLITKSGEDLEKILGEIADVIPTGWQYPEICCCRIQLNGITVTSSRFKEGNWKQVEDIFLNKEKRGTIEVHYLANRPEADEGPFLMEERSLIIELSNRIAEYLQIIDSKKELDSFRESQGRLFGEKDEILLFFSVDEKGAPSRFTYHNSNSVDALCRDDLADVTIMDILAKGQERSMMERLMEVSKGNPVKGRTVFLSSCGDEIESEFSICTIKVSGKRMAIAIFKT